MRAKRRIDGAETGVLYNPVKGASRDRVAAEEVVLQKVEGVALVSVRRSGQRGWRQVNRRDRAIAQAGNPGGVSGSSTARDKDSSSDGLPPVEFQQCRCRLATVPRSVRIAVAAFPIAGRVVGWWVELGITHWLDFPVVTRHWRATVW